MVGGHQIIGLKRGVAHTIDSSEPSDDELLLEEYYAPEMVDAPEPSDNLSLVRGLLVAFAAVWLAFNAWLTFARGAPLPTIEAVPQLLAVVAIPLVLIGVVYILLLRNSRAEASKFAQTAQKLRKESDALQDRLSHIGAQLTNARAAMEEQATLLQNYGASASANLEASAKLIAERAAEASEQTTSAERAGAELASQITGLVRSLPSLEERASAMAAQMNETGQAMEGRLDSLERRLQAVMAVSDDARLRTLSATKSLTTQLAQLQEETKAASEELDGMAELAASRIDVALSRARNALDETSTGLEAKVTALNVVVEQSRSALADISGEAITQFAKHNAEVTMRLEEFNKLLDTGKTLTSDLGSTLVTEIGAGEQRLAALEAGGVARNERLATTLARLTNEATKMDQALAQGNASAEQLITHSEKLLMALDSGMRELDESYPAALARLDGRMAETHNLILSASPDIEKLEAVTQGILSHAQETEELLRTQSAKLNDWIEGADGNIGSSRAHAEELKLVLHSAEESAARLVENAGPQLITALLRVKDTADQAAEHAKQTFASAIPFAAQTIGEASDQALQQAIGDRIVSQIAEISDVAERAVDAANQASDRLTQQLATIAETASAIESRIDEAQKSTEAQERESFTKQSAQLIDSLNSIAIDVTKVLSNDVPDISWAAYLKGDRGVFTRQAVKLLDAGDAREVLLHYDNEPEFRDFVNRYIHDFEALLRIILASRDGNALAITMLSSDMGKLYVALAQAIERLR